MCLNSLLVEFGQRAGLDSYEFVNSYNRLMNIFWGSNTIIPKTWHSLNDKTVEVRYQENNETLVEANYISEITAAFTTANARIRLYTMLEWLDPSQVIYCDLDSVVHLSSGFYTSINGEVSYVVRYSQGSNF
jgi:hypothetical protein